MFSFSSTWFMEGWLHPLQTPSHIIILFGLGLLLGQQGKGSLLKGWFGLVIAVLAGFALNHYFSWEVKYELFLLGLTLIFGLLMLLRLNLPALLLASLAVVTGVIIGLDSSPVMIPGMGSTTVSNWLAGAAISISLTVLVLALLALVLRIPLQGIILRVLGSWVATSAIMVLAFSFAK